MSLAILRIFSFTSNVFGGWAILVVASVLIGAKKCLCVCVCVSRMHLPNCDCFVLLHLFPTIAGIWMLEGDCSLEQPLLCRNAPRVFVRAEQRNVLRHRLFQFNVSTVGVKLENSECEKIGEGM